MFDFIIVGSGPSGGRFALELTNAGAKCVVIEAGRYFKKEDFPLSEAEGSAKLYWGGGVELSSDAKMGFLRARAVGGTSIVNQALLDEFDDDAWDDWRARSGIGEFATNAYKRHYAAVAADSSIQKVEEKYFNRNTKIFCESFDKNGYKWKALDRGQVDCKLDQGSDCMACLGGCHRDSKQSSMVTTIRKAEAKGLVVESEFEAGSVEHFDDRVVVHGIQRGKKTSIQARRLVIAAGSFGSTKLLLQSGFSKKLPYLGKGIAAHPQFMTYALFDEPVNAHKGAFQGVKSYDPKLRRMGMKLENVFAPPIATAMLIDGFGVEHLRRMRQYKHLASMEVAIRDEAVGVLRVDNSGKLHIDKKLTDIDQKKVDDGLALVKNLFNSTGAKAIQASSAVFGLHLMGGCAIGVDPNKSVVNPDFQVHGFKNITIADSSVFPSAPGINPSFTVMALSHRAAEKLK
jgi:choline dehydrogenase-like flavoprotein